MDRRRQPQVIGALFAIALGMSACTTPEAGGSDAVLGDTLTAEELASPAELVGEDEGSPRAPETSDTLSVADVEALAPEVDQDVEDYAIADYKSFDPSGIMIHFDFNESKLNGQAIEALNKIVKGLKQDPLARISVAGHADKQGAESYNLSLSEKRAKVIKDYLVKQGIEEDRLNPTYYGEAQPLEEGNTIRVFKKNRRGEFTINYGPSAFGK